MRSRSRSAERVGIWRNPAECVPGSGGQAVGCGLNLEAFGEHLEEPRVAELPAFGTLDELARHVRAIVDHRLLDSVLCSSPRISGSSWTSYWRAINSGEVAATR